MLGSVPGCGRDQRCVAIKDCPEVLTLARRVKNAKNVEKKRQILSTIRSRVCGAERHFTVCCDVNVDVDDADIINAYDDANVEDIVEVELDEDIPAQQDPCESKIRAELF